MAPEDLMVCRVQKFSALPSLLPTSAPYLGMLLSLTIAAALRLSGPQRRTLLWVCEMRPKTTLRLVQASQQGSCEQWL